MQTDRLDFPLLMPQQAQKHVTVNETIRLLDILVQTAVVSATREDEPETAEGGDLFILPAARSGLRWSTMHPGSIARFEDGAFVEVAPVPGQIAFVRDSGQLIVFDGHAWTNAPFAAQGPSRFGVNAEPSGANRLTVASDAELLTHDERTPGTGDARKVINKKDEANTASVVFQRGYSGRAEFGLVGNDDLSFRVSNDGAAFQDVLRLHGDTGKVSLAHSGPAACALDVAGPVRVGRYTVADLPPADAGAGQIVFVADEVGGASLAFSDGARWRRVSDRAIVA